MPARPEREWLAPFADMSEDDPRALLELAAHSRAWVHRRVESVTFVDVGSVRRRVSVDFTLPRTRPLDPDHESLVPLTLLRKRPLTNFDLRDESGKALPHLTRTENSSFALAGLLAHAARVLGPRPPAPLRECLERVVIADPGQAREALDEIASRWPELIADRTFRSRAGMLTGNFMVVVRVAGAHRRRVLKYSYDERRQRSRPPAGRWQRLRRGWFRIRVALGWKAWRELYELPNLGAAGSHHFEVAGEADLEVWTEILATAPQRGGGHRRLRTAGEKSFGVRAHAYVAGAPRGAIGYALVRMRVRRAGIMRGAPWIGALTAGILTAVWFWLPDVADSGRQVAPLMLVVPSILAAYLGRPGEHPLASEMLLGTRVLLLAGGFVAFVCALVLAAGAPASALRWIIGGAAVVAWSFFLALTRSRKGPRE